MNKHRILSNLLILGSGRIATMTISAFTLIVMSRYLGPGRLGELAFAEAIIGLLGQVNALGMETFLIKAIAREPERSGMLVSAAIIVRAVLALPTPLVLALYIYLAHLDAETSKLAYILCLGMVLWSFAAVLVWTLQALERMSYVAIIDVLLNVILGAVTIIVVAFDGGVAAFAAAVPLCNAALLIVTVYWAKPMVHFTWRFSWSHIREVITGSLAFWAKDITMTFYTFIDTVILGSLAGTRSVGFYSPPSRVFAVALFVPNVVGNATLPLLSRLGIEPGNDFIRVSRKTLSLLIITGVPLVVGLATFAGPIITLLFGSNFQPAVPVLVALSLAFLPMSLNSQFAQILTGRDQQWRWTGIMVASAVVNVLINFVSIPLAVRYWQNGALGAAIALLATELMMTIYGSLLLRDITLDLALGRVAVGALIAGAVQSGVIWIMGSQWFLLVIGEILGVAMYIATAVFFGALPRADVDYVWNLLLRRPQKKAA